MKKKVYKPDFLFISSPTNARNPHPPYYFLALSAYLEEQGFSVDILDLKGNDLPKDIREYENKIYWEVRQIKPNFIGLASFHSDYPEIMGLGKLIKIASPESKLIVGNCHATLNPEDFIYENSPFDVAVIGEGEEVCKELGSKRKEKWNLSDINGIAFWDNSFVKTGYRHALDISKLPMPAYDKIDMNWYLQPQKLIIRRIYTSMICIFAGRGCPYSCSFCAANSVWKATKGKIARLRKVQQVVDEINYLKTYYNIDFFYLFDDMFGFDKKWMEEWFIDYGAFFERTKLPYACQTRANTATEEMIRGLKETGCIQVDIGVESGSQKLLDNVKKKITKDQVRQVFEWCRKYKIRSFATMLLNLPGETEKDLKETKEFLEEIKPSAGVIFGVTTPYPGTGIYKDYCNPKLNKDEYGLLINNRLNPIERFRMASHKLDLEEIWDSWNRHFLATPMFERMWAISPFQKLYWRAIFHSQRKRKYLKSWIKDLPKTFFLWWSHKLKFYKKLKKIQYKGSEKWGE